MSGKLQRRSHCGICKWRKDGEHECHPPAPAQSKKLRIVNGHWQKMVEPWHEWRSGKCGLFADRPALPAIPVPPTRSVN